MLLVYTHKITPRFSYIFKHLFGRLLQTEIGFTTKIETFIAHSGPKMSYTKQALGGELHVRSQELLFQQGITDLDLNMHDWDGLPCFFSTGEQSAIPYDIFAASFYLLSRYEEYLPHVKDQHGRFPIGESLAFQYDFLDKPLVDLWALRFKELLADRFPEIVFQERIFSFMPAIDVPSAYAIRKKGLLRILAGVLRDLFSLNFTNILERAKVLLGLKRDPNDNFIRFNTLHQQYNVKAIFFFLMADFGAYDHNISPSNPMFQSLIKSVADFNSVSLMVSYKASKELELLKKEQKRLENVVHRDIKGARLNYGRLSLPESYRNMVDAEITEDYSMAYPDTIGFRASTCTPYLFYDIGAEIQLPLMVFSPCLSATNLQEEKSIPLIKERIDKMATIVKEVHGTFIPVLQNYAIGPSKEWQGWKEIYVEMVKKLSS